MSKIKRLQEYCSQKLHLLAILSLVGICLGFLGEWHWFLELFSHFLLYYCIIFGLAMLFVRGVARWIWATFWVISGTLLVYPLPFLPNVNSEEDGQIKPHWRLLWYNVHLDNPNPALEVQFIQQYQPDILAIAEMDFSEPEWQTLKKTYPYGCQHEEDSPFSLLIWSKYKLQTCQVALVEGVPFIRAILPDNTVVYAMHPPPPITRDLARIRQTYLQMTAQSISQEINVLAVGDFNTSPFSPIFHEFRNQADLSVSDKRPLFMPTWKTFGLNIDHALYRSQTANEINVQALPWQFSDHRALLVEWY